MYTENGSGGSRIGVITTFEDGDNGEDYTRRLKAIGHQIDNIYSFLNMNSVSEKASHLNTHEWIGSTALLPLFEKPLDEVTSLYRPIDIKRDI